MFDFEKLHVYLKAKDYNVQVSKMIRHCPLDRTIKDQLSRASLSIMLNIAEGTGRRTPADRRHFFVISRGSTFECVATLDLMKEIQIISEVEHQRFYSLLEEISKMLYGLIKSLE